MREEPTLFFRRLLAVITLAIGVWGHTADLRAAPVVASTASTDAVAQGIQTLYQRIETLKIDFVQETKLNLLGKTISKTGEMLLKRPGQFWIHYRTPPVKTYISNGKTLWVVLPEEQEVYQKSLKEGEIDEQAKIFLEGLGNLTQSFLVSPLSKEQKKEAMLSSEAGMTYLQLIPMTDSDFFSWLALAVDASYTVREMTIFNRSDNISHYRFLSLETHVPVEDGKFTLPAELKPWIKK